MPQDKPGKGWRQTSGAPSGRAKQTWKQESLERPAWASRRTVMLLQLGAALCVVLGLVFWLVWWLWPPRATTLFIVCADYGNNLTVPANLSGWRTATRLAQLASHDQQHFRLPRALTPFTDLDPWLQNIPDLGRGQLLVYLSLHYTLTPNGVVFLTDGANPQAISRQQPGQVVAFEECLQHLEKIAAKNGKVLLVDLPNAILAHEWGTTHVQLPHYIKSLDDRIRAVPGLVVILACDEGENAWAIPHLGTSVFGHFMVEGLLGAADGAGNGKRDGNISAAELFDYLYAQVDGWVRVNRQARQRPVLLPLGEEGRRRAADTVLVFGCPTHTPQEPQTAQPVWQVLRETWHKWDSLENSEAPPVALAPLLWQRYTAWVMRLEESALVGDAAQVKRIQDRLRALEEELTSGIGPGGWETTAFNLPSARVLEPGAARPEAIAKAFADPAWRLLWADNADVEATWLARWKSLLAQFAPGSDVPPRWLIHDTADFLLQQVIASPDRTRIARLKQIMGRWNRERRPVELHYLALVHRDMFDHRSPAESDAALLGAALTSARLAERAAWAQTGRSPTRCHWVFPWTRSLLEAADALRRHGQDRVLYGSGAPELHKSIEAYQQALETAAMVQECLHIRDRLLFRLPFLGEWLARRQATGTDPADATRLEELLQLWADLHAWCEEWRRLDAKTLSKLHARTKDLWTRYETRLEQPLLKHCRQLAEETASTQSAWHALDDALVVPFLGAELRMVLLERRRQVGLALHSATQEQLQHGTTGINPDDQVRHTKVLARERGRLLLARLAAAWATGQDRESPEQLRRQLDTLPSDARWNESLALVGQQLALHTLGAIPRVVQQIEQVRRTPSTDWSALVQADLMLRLAGPVTAETFASSAVGRQVLHSGLAAYLTWHAQRAYEDHWYGETSEEEPYYRRAGAAYARDALALWTGQRQLQPAKSEELASVQTLRHLFERLQQDTALKVVPAQAGPLVVTTEPKVTLRCQSQAPQTLPAGEWTIEWAGQGPGLERGAKPARLPFVWPAPTPGYVELEALVKPSPSTGKSLRAPERLESFVHLRAFYRGQVYDLRLACVVQSEPDIVYRRSPSTEAATLAVRADKDLSESYSLENAQVAIVLDCSGSMICNRDEVEAGIKEGRRVRAVFRSDVLHAVRKVIHTLPASCTVSFWTFGEAGTPSRYVEHPESTVRRLLDPGPFTAARRDELLRRIADIEPYNESPVAYTMGLAKRDFDSEFQGLKLLLVISDGMDNRFHIPDTQKDLPAKAPRFNPDGKKQIPAFLQEQLAGSGIVCFMVFAVTTADDKEREQAQKQFEVLRELGGDFFFVTDLNTLAGRLQDVLRRSQRLHYRVERERGQIVYPAAGVGPEQDISNPGEADRWFGAVPPGTYLLRVGNDDRYKQYVEVHRGDRLLLRLTRRGFVRDLFATDFADRPRQYSTDKHWLAAVLQSRRRPQDRVLEAMLTVEDAAERSAPDGTLRLLYPRFLWMEAVSPASQHPLAQRYLDLRGYPAPAWHVELAGPDGWPVDAHTQEPLPTAWRIWAARQPAFAAVLRKSVHFQDLNQLSGRRLDSWPDVAAEETARQVTIESAGLETVAVTDPQGKSLTVPALVLRLRHAPDRPILVELEPDPGGAEHRFFTALGRTTTLFWPMSLADFEGRLRAIRLLDVERSKKLSEDAGGRIELRLDRHDARTRPAPVPVPASRF